MMNFFREDSHLSEEAVALYVDALKLKTIEQIPEEIRDHVAECPVCKIDIEELFLLLEDQQYAMEEQHSLFQSPLLSRKNSIVWVYRIAAVLLVALGSYGVYQLSRHPGDKNAGGNLVPAAPTVAISADTSPVKGNEKLLADNFTVLPLLEDLVRTEYRSNEVEIQAPALGAEVGNRIVFKWSRVPGKFVIVRILTNAGREVHSAKTETNTYLFNGRLTPGLYYWKLESEEELLCVGRFLKK
ncbi:MAG: hypothetical protein NTV54_12095 [Ignavibacteriales bacterium]|nr:hypothetical protein [Ignavibacteriales bacterium]